MSVNSSCPCCSSPMLLHLSSRRSYWFCHHCRLEMPSFKQDRSKTSINSNSSQTKKIVEKLPEPVAAI